MDEANLVLLLETPDEEIPKREKRFQQVVADMKEEAMADVKLVSA